MFWAIVCAGGAACNEAQTHEYMYKIMIYLEHFQSQDPKWLCTFVMAWINLERSDPSSFKQKLLVNRAQKHCSGALWRCQMCMTNESMQPDITSSAPSGHYI